MAEVQAPLSGIDRRRAARLALRVGRVVLGLVVRYGPVAILALTLARAILVPTFWGERPRPEVPPDGYKSENLNVRLMWSRGDETGDLTLEVADEPDFERLIVSRKTRGTSFVIPSLERGRTYYWRLERGRGAIVAFFRTTENAVRF